MQQPDYAAWLDEAVGLLKSGSREEAQQILRQITRQNPTFVDAWGWLYRASDIYEEKQHSLQQMIRLNPNDMWARQELNRLEQGGEVYEGDPQFEYAEYADAPPVPEKQKRQKPNAIPPTTEEAPTYRPHRSELPGNRSARSARREPLNFSLIVAGGAASGFMALNFTVVVMLVAVVLGMPWLIGEIGNAVDSVACIDPNKPCEPEAAFLQMQRLLEESPLNAQAALSGTVAFASQWASGITDLQDISAEKLSEFVQGASDIWVQAGFEEQYVNTMLAGIAPILSAVVDSFKIAIQNWLIVGAVGFSILLALFGFLLVFMRARSRRFVHWALSVGAMWSMGACLCLGLIWGISQIIGGLG